MLLSFELTMPNRGSWNGQWSGQDRKYYVIRNLSKRFFDKQAHLTKLLDGKSEHFYYRWDDGWGANVEVQIVDATIAKKRRKLSVGFCGYEWMIASIIHEGAIMTETDRKQITQTP